MRVALSPRYTLVGLTILFGALFSSCGPPKVSLTEITLREMRSDLSDLRHGLSHLNVELKMLHSKTDTQGAIISDLQEEMSSGGLRHKKSLKSRFVRLEKRLEQTEKQVSQELKDIRKLKTSTSDASASLAHYKKKLNEVEGRMSHMHQALGVITEAFEDRELETASQHLLVGKSLRNGL